MVNGRRLKAALALAGVFLLGAATGGLSIYVLEQREYAQELTLGPGLRHERRILRAFSDELELTEEQRDAVGAILSEHRRRRQRLMDDLDEVCVAPIRTEKARIDDAIRALLSADQRRRFDALLERQAQLAGGRRGPRSGGPAHGFGPRRGAGPRRSYDSGVEDAVSDPQR